MLSDRLKQARQAAGLSQRDLAERAGISAMAISHYEKGRSTPSSGVLLALAKVLGVRVEYFFRPRQVKLQAVNYRKHARVSDKTLQRIEARVLEQVERFLELEQFFPTLPIQAFEVPENLPSLVDNYDQIEAVANRIREVWQLGLDPIPDLTDTVEARGILVFGLSLSGEQRFDGLAANVDGYPVVVLCSEWPGDRQRFTLAHELGHLVLQGRLAPELDEEKAANRFAGAFLAPKEAAFALLGECRTSLEPRELLLLKHEYGLSMNAWLYRVGDLGILTATAYEQAWRLFGVRGWRQLEPGPAYPSEKPKLFEQLVFRALAEDLVSESKAAELLGESLMNFHQRRNLGSTSDAAASL
jgi:Zn-dependent peptidase ImmA (M78 family)/DNA-binding XRE family transcriptional regulator